MAIVYLEPGDVGPEDARKVLDFLNAATTAEQIARRVEIAGELDVGVGVARRILESRERQGPFQTLAQVAAVPLVGPERFTELVVTLSGARRPGLSPPPDAAQGEIMRELRALRVLVEGLRAAGGGGLTASLRALQETPFLGQQVNLVARVADAAGLPRVGVPVTLITTWGRLRAVSGVELREGAAVTAETGADGGARAILFAPTGEDLLDRQQAVLSTALRLLDPKAATPREAEPGLRELARTYRLGGSDELRHAVDILYRDFGREYLEAVNARDRLDLWAHRDASVFACAQAGSSIAASATICVRFRDWLGPWLQVLRELVAGEGRLPDRLADARARSESADAILGRVIYRIGRFLDDQPGIAGEAIGRDVVQQSVRGFMDAGLTGLPAEDQTRLFGMLRVASGAVSATGTNVLTAVGQARTELRTEIDGTVARVNDELLAPIEASVAELQVELDGKVDTGTFTTFQTEVNSKLDLSVTTGQLAALEADLVAQLGAKADQTEVQELQQALQGKVDLATFNEFQTEVGSRLDPAVTSTELAAVERELATRIDSKADAGTVQTQLDAFGDDITRLQGRSSELATSVDGLQTTVRRIDTDVVRLKQRPGSGPTPRG